MSIELLQKLKSNEQSFSITGKAHPERKDGEIFMGNVSLNSNAYDKIGWKSKRMGNRAYSQADSILPQSRPVFVLASEIESAP